MDAAAVECINQGANNLCTIDGDARGFADGMRELLQKRHLAIEQKDIDFRPAFAMDAWPASRSFWRCANLASVRKAKHRLDYAFSC